MDDKKVIWNKQSEKDLFNEQVDWSSTYYAVIMKNLTEKVVVSYADEGYDGTRNVYYDFIGDDDKVVDFDEILLWREIEKPAVNKVKLEFKKGDILYEQKTMSILLVYERKGSWLMTFCDYWMLKEKLHVQFPYENYGLVQEMSLVLASEEQKKLLFKKIKEEGYEWDADKLELKYLRKIEQKP